MLTSADGDLTRTMNWGYYPDGKLESISDDGIPTGFYAEVTQASDPGAAASGSWTTTQCGSTAGCEGTQYETHASGSGSDTFTWPLYVPADGNYTVYVKYPSVPGAAAGSQFTVSYSGGSSTQTVDQTKNAGAWVALGKYALTQSGKGQQVSLTESSGGTVVAGAVKIVRDNSGTTNTAIHGYTYTYDPDGQQTGIADSSPGAAVADYVTTYDQDGRTASVAEESSSGTAVHTTTYGYDADSNENAMTHDGAPSTYTFNDLDQLAKETDAKSSTDASPQVSSFTYTPTGQAYTQTKPNSNVVTSTYYANNLPYSVTEKTSGGTLVSSHQYQYDPDGNTTQNTEQLMSADSSSYLNHTLAYTYTPLDQVATVSTDGTQTESYTHDAANNVTAQTVNGTTTTYGYAQGQLVTATVGGTTADYNYDPFGRLDTVTAAGQTLQSNTYDGFDNLASTTQMTSSGSMATTSYTYDSLNRMATQTTGAGKTSFSYLGASSEVASESDPGSTSKTYDYTPAGARLSQTTTDSSGTSTPGYYSYNAHSDVEAVTGSSGTTTATYGYTAYGNPVPSMFTGADKNNATSSATSTTQLYSAYRFNAMRWDSTSGQYDMGFRNYDPGLNQFTSRDMYDGATQNMGLSTDPFTGGGYAFGGGNPVSNVELDGHVACAGTATSELSDCTFPKMAAPASTPASSLSSVAVNGSVGGFAAGTNILPSLSATERNAQWLRSWAMSQNWVEKAGSNVETYGYINSSGKFVWTLQLKFQASTRPGLQAGSAQPRFSARFDNQGNSYTNPFTGQVGSKRDPLMGSSDPNANLSHIPLEEPWVAPSTLDLAQAGLKIGGRALVAVGVAYDIYDVASAPSDQRGAVAARDAGGLAGGLAGGAYGAELGASIGLAGGPVGAAVGGIVGGIAGGIIGSGIGESAVNGILNWL